MLHLPTSKLSRLRFSATVQCVIQIGTPWTFHVIVLCPCSWTHHQHIGSADSLLSPLCTLWRYGLQLRFRWSLSPGLVMMTNSKRGNRVCCKMAILFGSKQKSHIKHCNPPCKPLSDTGHPQRLVKLRRKAKHTFRF